MANRRNSRPSPSEAMNGGTIPSLTSEKPLRRRSNCWRTCLSLSTDRPGPGGTGVVWQHRAPEPVRDPGWTASRLARIGGSDRASGVPMRDCYIYTKTPPRVQRLPAGQAAVWCGQTVARIDTWLVVRPPSRTVRRCGNPVLWLGLSPNLSTGPPATFSVATTGCYWRLQHFRNRV